MEALGRAHLSCWCSMLWVFRRATGSLVRLVVEGIVQVLCMQLQD